MGKLDAVLEQANEAEIIAENREGVKITTYEDAVNLQQKEIMERQIESKKDVTPRKMNPDGTPARTRSQIAAVNLNRMLANRYRYAEVEVGDESTVKGVQVVVDKRAVMDHEAGANIYTKNVEVFELHREGKKLVCDRVFTISDDEFVKEFTGELDNKSMLEIVPAIEDRGAGITSDALDI